MNAVIQLWYSAFVSLGVNEVIVLTCKCWTKHTTSSAILHLEMDSLEKSSTVGHLDGNQSFNETNMTMAVMEPCTYCLVVTPVYLVVLAFILTILSFVGAAKTSLLLFALLWPTFSLPISQLVWAFF